MSAKKTSNSPENFTSSSSDDERGMSLRARRGIRSRRIRENLPLIEENLPQESTLKTSSQAQNSQLSEHYEAQIMPTNKTDSHTSNHNILPHQEEKNTPTATPAPAKRRGRPPRRLKQEESLPLPQEQETLKTEQEPAAPKKRGRPRKNPLPETKQEESVQNLQPTTIAPSSSKIVSKKSKDAAAPTKKKEQTEARPQERKKKKAVNSEQEEILSTLKEAPSEKSPPQEEQASSVKFTDLHLSTPLLQAIDALGYTNPTPVQAQSIPHILAGKDVLAVAQTGTGKTASFILPLLEKLSTGRARARMPRCLILEPTRELALQVSENIKLYGKYLNLNHALLIGGNSIAEQKENLQRGVDILIATPGRLIDIFERGGLLLNQTDFLVIDEADRMLDMGFIPEIEKIVSLLPKTRQTLLFSATMAPTIKKIADDFLYYPEEITVTRESSINNAIHEFVFFIKKEDKHRAIKRLLQTELIQNAIIFCNRKRDVDLLFSYLSKHHFSVGHLHGDLDQNTRFETLERFRAQEIHLLVCSDVAARGIDISGLSHVFNYDLPFNAEDYVHRIGRTGRAGNIGYAFNFVDPEEIIALEAIEKLTKKTIEQAVIEGFETALPKSNIIQPHMEQAFLQKDEKEASFSAPKEPSQTQPLYENSVPVASIKEQAPILEPYQEYGQSLPLDKNGFLPAISEKDAVQKGFGEYTPSFMKISFAPQSRSFPVA